MATQAERDERLVSFLEAAGELPLDLATEVLASHDWDLQRALTNFVGGFGPAPIDVDHEGPGQEDVRSPMRTGYVDQMIGGPDDFQAFGRDGPEHGGGPAPAPFGGVPFGGAPFGGAPAFGAAPFGGAPAFGGAPFEDPQFGGAGGFGGGFGDEQEVVAASRREHEEEQDRVMQQQLADSLASAAVHRDEVASGAQQENAALAQAIEDSYARSADEVRFERELQAALHASAEGGAELGPAAIDVCDTPPRRSAQERHALQAAALQAAPEAAPAVPAPLPPVPRTHERERSPRAEEREATLGGRGTGRSRLLDNFAAPAPAPAPEPAPAPKALKLKAVKATPQPRAEADSSPSSDAFVAALQRARQQADLAQLEGCLKVVRQVITNIVNNPGNKQFMTIKKANKAFGKVLACPGGVDLLYAIGFVDQEDGGEPVVHMPSFDRKGLWDALAKVDLLVKR